jgi:pimeloyl-ACP methyl ester carboxylesterase
MLEFRRAGDPARHAAVGYEELVATPEPTLRRLCAFLGLAFDGGMLRPYDGGRMTDGVHPWSMPIDDPNFRTHKGIDGRLADVWRTIELPAPLRAETVEVARKLGYELPRERIAAPIRGEPAMRESFVEVRGLRLAVCSWGDADGPLVLCTHGGLDHGASWEGVARGLTARGYRVVAPDLRGHGRSAHAAPGSAYHVLDFVADLDALVRVLGRGPVVLVGHSFGAGVAALYAGARSRHDGVPVEAVVLAEPVTMPDFGPADLGRQLEYLAAPGEHPILPDLEAAAGRLRSRTPELARDWALRMAERLTEPCDGGLRWRSDFRIMRSQIVTFGLSPGAFPNLVAREIAAPVTLVYGAESGLMERAEQSMLREAAPVVVLPGGHNLHLQSPAALAEAIAIAHARVGR